MAWLQVLRDSWWFPTPARIAAALVAIALSFGAVAIVGYFQKDAVPAGPTSSASPSHATTAPPASSPRSPSAPTRQDPPFGVIWGRCVSFRFGYSVDLPDDLFAFTVSPPLPQHGCTIVLDEGEHFQGYFEIWERLGEIPAITVYGFYNAAFDPSCDALLDERLRHVRDNFDDVRVIRRTRTRLGPHTASRAVFCYTEPGGSRVMVDAVVAERFDSGLSREHCTTDETGRRIPDIYYLVDLSTTPERFAADRKVFEQVLRSWRVRPIE